MAGEIKGRHDGDSFDQFSRPQNAHIEIPGRGLPDETSDLARKIKMANGGGDEEEARPLSPEQRKEYERRFEGVIEKISNAETPEERKYWTYFALDRIVGYNDDWSARMLREQMALKVASIGGELSDLMGIEIKSGSPEDLKQKGLEQSLSLIQDVDKFFDQWFGLYKKMAPSSKIHQLSFIDLPEYMTPDGFARVYGEMPGLHDAEGEYKEWRSMSEQVDLGIRAFMYLSLQSDDRWSDDLKWFKEGAGFKKLFPNESSEKDWLLRLKLKTLPNENNKVAYLRGRSYESLTDDDKTRLDSIKALNRFADASNGGTVKAVVETVEELVAEGKHKDNKAMKMQSRMAVNFADKTFRMLGLAAMYGTRATKIEGGRAARVNAEDYPWSDAMTDLTRPQDNITYCIQNSYYPGPSAWVNFAPEHMMVDFLRMTSVRDTKSPDSKGNTRSVMELFVEGKTIGEIMKDEDHIGDWSYRAYLVRLLFSFKEDSGAYLAMNGELTRGKNIDNASNSVFWEGVEKSIHIVCRDWIVTKGKYKEWFDQHRAEIPAFAQKVNGDRIKEGKSPLTGNELQIEAEDVLLKKHVERTKNRWKAIAWLSAIEGRDETSIKVAINAAKRSKYLDGKVLDQTPRGLNSYNIKQVLNDFIKLAEESVS